jgi:hypothetical protein
MDDKEAMVRWQGYAREQRSTVNTLFLTYAAALLGLESSLLLSHDVTRIDRPLLFEAAGLAAMTSLVAGCVVVLVRLRDARLTARIVRYREQGKTDKEIDSLRRGTKRAGWWTNFLLPVQVITFTAAAFFFLLWVIRTFGAKLATPAG